MYWHNTINNMTILAKIIGSIVCAGTLLVLCAFIIYFGKALEFQINKLGWNDSKLNNLKILLIILLILSCGIFISTLLPK